MKTKLELTFSDTPYSIHIEHEQDDYPCYEANAQLVVEGKIIANLFIEDDLVALLDTLISSAYEAINKIPPRPFGNDIGLTWNNSLYHLSIHTCEQEDCKEAQEDDSPSPMWSTPQGINSWLYWSGTEIIFEVTNSYPWFFRDPEPNETYYSYEEFLKNYKPIFKKTISQQTAQEWFEKALSWYPDSRLLPRPSFK